MARKMYAILIPPYLFLFSFCQVMLLYNPKQKNQEFVTLKPPGLSFSSDSRSVCSVSIFKTKEARELSRFLHMLSLQGLSILFIN